MKLDGREHQQMKYAELKKSSNFHLVAKATTTTKKVTPTLHQKC